MKKSLLALAVLGAFAGAASAQSSVTLYGRVDLAATKNSGTDNKGIDNGSGNRLGVRGVEDLGGGLSAIFNIEHRFNADTGSQTDANRFWFGRSIVGLQSASWGSIVLGREYTNLHTFSQAAWDPWGHDTVVSQNNMAIANSVATNIGGTIGLTRLGISTARVDSSVSYKYSNSGFSVGGQIGEATDTFNNTANKPWNVGGRYQAGPIDVAIGYEMTGAEIVEKAKILVVDGSYDFGVVKVGAWFAKGNTATDIDRRSYAGFVTAPLGAGQLRVLLGRVQEDAVYTNGWDTVNTIGAIGYHYSLSKRTTIYADFVRNTGAVDSEGFNKSGYDFGLKHNF